MAILWFFFLLFLFMLICVAFGACPVNGAIAYTFIVGPMFLPHVFSDVRDALSDDAVWANAKVLLGVLCVGAVVGCIWLKSEKV